MESGEQGIFVLLVDQDSMGAEGGALTGWLHSGFSFQAYREPGTSRELRSTKKRCYPQDPQAKGWFATQLRMISPAPTLV